MHSVLSKTPLLSQLKSIQIGETGRCGLWLFSSQGNFMSLKTSFANVLRALRSKRHISQRDFADTTSRTYLSKLELAKSSITLDKLDQISRRLDLSPLTLLTLTLSEETHSSVAELITQMRREMVELQEGGGLQGLAAKIFDLPDPPTPS